jgi:dethiobiotin synthetase
MSPISDVGYNADLAAAFGYPLVVVAANALGTINATLLTQITASTYELHGEPSPLEICGIVLNSPTPALNDPSRASNRDELARRCAAPLLATVPHGGGFDRTVDWWRLATRQLRESR